jgi:hypothetical protein
MDHKFYQLNTYNVKALPLRENDPPDAPLAFKLVYIPKESPRVNEFPAVPISHVTIPSEPSIFILVSPGSILKYCILLVVVLPDIVILAIHPGLAKPRVGEVGPPGLIYLIIKIYPFGKFPEFPFCKVNPVTVPDLTGIAPC